MLDKKIYRRGSPGSGIYGMEPKNSEVHLRINQHRPGMKESNSWDGDYPTSVVCHNGSWHIWYTNDPSKVTCEKCKERYDSSQRIHG